MRPFLSFTKLKQSVSIATVLRQKGLLNNFTIRGDQLYGPCPVHGGDNPTAFVVSITKNLWRCFTQCDAGGDVIELVRRLDGKDYRQVALYLTELMGKPFPFQDRIPGGSATQTFKPYTVSLPLDHATPWLKRKGIRPETARHFEAGAYYGRGFLAGSIGVRMHDLKARPIGYAARQLDPTMAKRYGKWKFPPKLPKGNILYNFHRIDSRIKKGVVVVECPWAVMRLTQINVPALALLGIHLSPTQRQILSEIRKIIIMLDADEAGKQAAIRISNMLALHSHVSTIQLPDGLDPDDLSDQSLITLTNPFFS